MQLFVISSLLVLAIWEPLHLDAKKVVIMMPRHQRRSHMLPWRQLHHFKKNGFPSNVYPGPKFGFPYGPQMYRPKDLNFAKNQYPQGGDDFDQGHEGVNHVMVPHGKGISHAVSFGKGYIPFDNYKDHRPSASHHHDYQVDHSQSHNIGYNPSMMFSTGPTYSQAFLSQQADAYIGPEDNNQPDELQDRAHKQTVQNIGPSQIPQVPTNGPIIPSHFGHQGPTGKPNGLIFTPSAIPQAAANGNQHGIVLRDSIAFDDYNRKVQELTKNWPATFGNSNNLVPGSIGNTRHGTNLQQFRELSRQFNSNGFSGQKNFPLSPKFQQGYQVKEDVADTAPHDFRSMPIQMAPITGVTPMKPNIQYIHQPVQHIYSQPQRPTTIHGNYAANNPFQGLVHG